MGTTLFANTWNLPLATFSPPLVRNPSRLAHQSTRQPHQASLLRVGLLANATITSDIKAGIPSLEQVL